MLTLSDIMKVGKFDAQYGPPEHSFSPRWHEDQQRNGSISMQGAALRHKIENVMGQPANEAATDDSYNTTVSIRYMVMPDGNVITRLDGDTAELPPGAYWEDSPPASAEKLEAES
jgi:hypothetical protein